jgi:hypothetical protein
MYELQKLLTHSSPQMTQRYAHLHDDALRKASDLAGALFSEAGENPTPALDVPATPETKVRKKKASVA